MLRGTKAGKKRLHTPAGCGRIAKIIFSAARGNGDADILEVRDMGKLGKKNKDSKEAANKKIAQQLAALKRKQAGKKK